MKSGCVSQQTKSPRSVELPVLPSPKKEKAAIKSSKTGKWRAAALLSLTALMVIHFIQWRMTGRTVTPIEPSEAMHTLQTGAVNAGFIFFTLAILATLIFGRFVCGWACHVLALQDFCGWLLKKMGLTPRPFRSRLLVFVPLIVALYMFVWPTLYRFFVKPAGEPLFPEFTNHLITTEYWATFPPLWVAIPFLFVCGFMTVYFLGSKGFCTYACPYGGFFSLADKVSPGRIRVTDACEQCGHCTAACTSNVKVHLEVKEYGMVVDQGCMKCMDCVSVCPNDALYFGFGKPALAVANKVPKNYSLTWPEEAIAAAVFALSFYAAWDVYQLVPMLMALGIAAVTTFLAMRTIRLIRSADLTFYKYSLKSGGRIRRAGWAFLSFSVLWIGLNTHSGWVRYNEQAGAIRFESVQIPDELALAQDDPGQWLAPADRENIAQGKEYFHAAARTGLFTNKQAISKLAWLEYLSGNTEEAEKLLARAANVQDDSERALSLYYRGAILNRAGRSNEALESLNAAIAERPDLIAAREEIGESLWQLGRREEAVAVWTEIVRQNPARPLASFMLSGAAASVGMSDAAAEQERQGLRYTPADARFYWMLGLRLQNLGMSDLADKKFRRAIQLDPKFAIRRRPEPKKQP